MPTLPWRQPADAHTPGAAPTGAEAVVLATRLGLHPARSLPLFLLAALALRRRVLAAEGALGVSLAAELRSGTLWTLSAWRDHAALDAFVRGGPHVDAMRRFRRRTVSPVFISWTLPDTDLPVDWEEARRRVAEAENPPGS
ncbi:DUF3291 domain-containing protein [Peterkaempfera sp. SMS 1(5)a]|uniref:DUF3291 domain-containing protein n=1 Tax=Peterkaempfera podocarpi TaxID=3232308 RepID=UPI003671641E